MRTIVMLTTVEIKNGPMEEAEPDCVDPFWF